MTDDDTGLLLLEHRYYVPRLGRFLTQDPKGQAGGLNLYEYCGDNPVDHTDPTGEQAEDAPEVPEEDSEPESEPAPQPLSPEQIKKNQDLDFQIWQSLHPVEAKEDEAMARQAVAKYKAEQEAEEAQVSKPNNGRGGRQARLRSLANDDKVSSADRGWIKQDMNAMRRGRTPRTSIRVPPGKNLAHRRGFEARKGYDYSYSVLQGRDLHLLQHDVGGYK